MTVNRWSRWELAYPFMALSLLLLIGNLFGMATWWSDESWSYRILAIVACLILVGNIAVSVSIGVKPARTWPWRRMGLVLLGIAFAAGVALIRTLAEET